MGLVQVATPLQQAKCELLAFPWTPDVLAMCNLLAASASEMADVKRSYEAQAKGAAHAGASHQTSPFNCLLMPELASLQDGAPLCRCYLVVPTEKGRRGGELLCLCSTGEAHYGGAFCYKRV